MKPDGFRKIHAGRRVWFLTTNNVFVEVRIVSDVARTIPVCGRDYTIFLFDRDLTSSIEPIRVAATQEVIGRFGFSDFYKIRATSSPSSEMQRDMDELCREQRLNPEGYQLHWVDLSTGRREATES